MTTQWFTSVIGRTGRTFVYSLRLLAESDAQGKDQCFRHFARHYPSCNTELRVHSNQSRQALVDDVYTVLRCSSPAAADCMATLISRIGSVISYQALTDEQLDTLQLNLAVMCVMGAIATHQCIDHAIDGCVMDLGLEWRACVQRLLGGTCTQGTSRGGTMSARNFRDDFLGRHGAPRSALSSLPDLLYELKLYALDEPRTTIDLYRGIRSPDPCTIVGVEGLNAVARGCEVLGLYSPSDAVRCLLRSRCISRGGPGPGQADATDIMDFIDKRCTLKDYRDRLLRIISPAMITQTAGGVSFGKEFLEDMTSDPTMVDDIRNAFQVKREALKKKELTLVEYRRQKFEALLRLRDVFNGMLFLQGTDDIFETHLFSFKTYSKMQPHISTYYSLGLQEEQAIQLKHIVSMFHNYALAEVIAAITKVNRALKHIEIRQRDIMRVPGTIKRKIQNVMGASQAEDPKKMIEYHKDVVSNVEKINYALAKLWGMDNKYLISFDIDAIADSKMVPEQYKPSYIKNARTDPAAPPSGDTTILEPGEAPSDDARVPTTILAPSEAPSGDARVPTTILAPGEALVGGGFVSDPLHEGNARGIHAMIKSSQFLLSKLLREFTILKNKCVANSNMMASLLLTTDATRTTFWMQWFCDVVMANTTAVVVGKVENVYLVFAVPSPSKDVLAKRTDDVEAPQLPTTSVQPASKVMFGIACLSLLRLLVQWMALEVAKRISKEGYVKRVYADNDNPPSLMDMLYLTLSIDVSALMLIALVLVLLSDSSEPTVVDDDFMFLFLVNSIVATLITLACGSIIAHTMYTKRFFLYKDQGLRTIDAFADMLLVVFAVNATLQYHRIFTSPETLRRSMWFVQQASS